MFKSKQPKLKPCPFCGGEAVFFGNWGCDTCYVRCNECSAQGKTIYCDTENERYENGDSEVEEKKAIEAWNRRVNNNAKE